MKNTICEEKLESLTHQLRLTATHQEASTEAETKKMITRVYYGKYGTSEGLSGKTLRSLGKYNTFLKMAQSGCQNVTQATRQTIENTIQQSYKLCYDGTLDALQSTTDANGKVDSKALHEKFDGLKATTTETLGEIVTNKTMTTALHNYSAGAISQIRQQLVEGLVGGESYKRMAKRVEKCANHTYIKALNITRTECNRAINRGLQDAAVDANPYMQAAGYVEVKIWHSMKDESVRDTHANLDGKWYTSRTCSNLTAQLRTAPETSANPARTSTADASSNNSLMTAKEFLDSGGADIRRGK